MARRGKLAHESGYVHESGYGNTSFLWGNSVTLIWSFSSSNHAFATAWSLLKIKSLKFEILLRWLEPLCTSNWRLLAAWVSQLLHVLMKHTPCQNWTQWQKGWWLHTSISVKYFSAIKLATRFCGIHTSRLLVCGMQSKKPKQLWSWILFHSVSA